MSAPAITVDGLGKRYRLGTGARYRTLRDWIASTFSSAAAPVPEVWALRDASFTIPRGEVVGLIGRNGAGKSTLLKLLARITEPTTGSIAIRGRVGSLLEVGAGFHPELTGRENVYLYGTMIGMRRTEIRSRFDEIVAFSGIDGFIDTPVKNYSSGMYMRLAFAVAAHLDCEILLADEALAVGDAQFQQKCLGKMGDVAKGGRTVVFVSHNMTAIRQICPKSLWLDQGQVRSYGSTGDVVAGYLQSLAGDSARSDEDIARQLALCRDDPAIEFAGVEVGQDGADGLDFVTGKPITIRIAYRVKQESFGLRPYILLYDAEDTLLFRSFAHGDQELARLAAGDYVSRVEIPADLLAPIAYKIVVSAALHNVRHCYDPGVTVRVALRDQGRLRYAYAHDGRIGMKLAPLLTWSTEGPRP